MSLTDHAPATLRMLFAIASGLSATQRAAIRVSLADETWYPRQKELPDTWGMVEAWYEKMQAQLQRRKQPHEGEVTHDSHDDPEPRHGRSEDR